MINRELIRIKIVQLTYAYYQNGNHNLKNAEKELITSLDKAYDLYNFLLTLIVAITKEARNRLEIQTQRAERERTSLPSSRFVENSFCLQLEDNKALQQWFEDQKLSWDNDLNTVRHLLDDIEQSAFFTDYMSSPEKPDYEADRELWRKIYKNIISDNDYLSETLEEKSLYWNDDKDIVDTFVLKTIKRFDQKEGRNQELLPQYKDMEDLDFARKLFRATILNCDLYQQYMSEVSHNWDFSRLAYMDIVIMQIAIAEMLTFPLIPINVTINEFVELSKIYSTPKSWRYINGMLDNIARHLSETGKLQKPVPERRH